MLPASGHPFLYAGAKGSTAVMLRGSAARVQLWQRRLSKESLLSFQESKSTDERKMYSLSLSIYYTYVK
jgi:hypothetical protein